MTLKVYNEVAIELCMACLKFIKKTQKPTEEILYRLICDVDESAISIHLMSGV